MPSSTKKRSRSRRRRKAVTTSSSSGSSSRSSSGRSDASSSSSSSASSKSRSRSRRRNKSRKKKSSDRDRRKKFKSVTVSENKKKAKASKLRRAASASRLNLKDKKLADLCKKLRKFSVEKPDAFKLQGLLLDKKKLITKLRSAAEDGSSSSSSSKISREDAQAAQSEIHSITRELVCDVEDTGFAAEALAVVLNAFFARPATSDLSTRTTDHVRSQMQFLRKLEKTAREELYRGTIADVLAEVLRGGGKGDYQISSSFASRRKNTSAERTSTAAASGSASSVSWLADGAAAWARSWAAFDEECAEQDFQDEDSAFSFRGSHDDTTGRSSRFAFNSDYLYQDGISSDRGWADDIVAQMEAKKEKLRNEQIAEAMFRKQEREEEKRRQQDAAYRNLSAQQQQQTKEFGRYKEKLSSREKRRVYEEHFGRSSRGAAGEDASTGPGGGAFFGPERPPGTSSASSSGAQKEKSGRVSGSAAQPNAAGADEARWQAFVSGQTLLSGAAPRLTLSDIPWPNSILSGGASVSNKKVLLLRWHPDKLLPRLKPFVADEAEFGKIAEKCKEVMQKLNQVLAA